MTRTLRPGRTFGIVVAVLVALAAGVAGGYFARGRISGNDSPPPGKTGGDSGRRVTALARLQPAGGVIPIHGPPGDRIDKIYEKDGKPIGPGTVLKAGDKICDLFSKKQRDEELAVARLQLSEAKRALDAATKAADEKINAARTEADQVLANKQSDLDALDAKIEFIEKQRDTADRQLKALKKLRSEGTNVADVEIDKVQLLFDQAIAELKGNKALREKTRLSYDHGNVIARAKLAAAVAERNEAIAKNSTEVPQKKLELAEYMAGLTTLTAPVDGVVLKVTGRTGQPTGLDPILQMAASGSMIAVAEVYESDVDQLTQWLSGTGQVEAEIRSPALPGGDKTVLNGVVRSPDDVNRMIARNQVFALGPREDADRRVVEVIVHLNDNSSRLASSYVGLQVTVVLTPQATKK